MTQPEWEVHAKIAQDSVDTQTFLRLGMITKDAIIGTGKIRTPIDQALTQEATSDKPTSPFKAQNPLRTTSTFPPNSDIDIHLQQTI